MNVKHTMTLEAKCPVNGERDTYTATIELDYLIGVESLLSACKEYTDIPWFQEQVTDHLARRFRAKVTTQGRHGPVLSEVVCDASKLSKEELSDIAAANGNGPKPGEWPAEVEAAYREYHSTGWVFA